MNKTEDDELDTNGLTEAELRQVAGQCCSWLSCFPSESNDDDDDDCQLVEHSSIHGKAMLVAYTGAVSLPDDEQRKTQNAPKKRQWDGWWCKITSLKTSESWVLCEKLKKTHILSVPDGGHSRVWGQSWKKPWSQTGGKSSTDSSSKFSEEQHFLTSMKAFKTDDQCWFLCLTPLVTVVCIPGRWYIYGLC